MQFQGSDGLVRGHVELAMTRDRCRELRGDVVIPSEVTILSEGRFFRAFMLQSFSRMKLFGLVIDVMFAPFWTNNSRSAQNVMSFESAWGF